MKSQFINCKYYNQAKKAMPWAEIIIRVCGGFHGFESHSDYKLWKKQI